jgi:hypothetical protein
MKFAEIFNGLKRAYGCTFINTQPINGEKLKGKSFIKRESVTLEHYENHIKGIEPTLGIVPITDDNTCIWGCIDVDSYAGFDHKKLLEKINLFNLPLVVCRSKSGGAHIFLFSKTFIEAKIMRDKLIEIRAILGFGNAEIFPKQIELKSEEDTGNFLNLPYFQGDKTTRYAFTEQGTAATLEQFYSIVEFKRCDVHGIKVKRIESEFSDGPPCIEILAANKISSNRNLALFHFAVFAKKKWKDWKEKVSWFHKDYMEGELEQNEIDTIKKQHEKKDWGFLCKQEPMCSHCDKDLCKKRKHGIGNAPTFPELSDLQEIQLEHPYYYLNVDGKRLRLDSAKHLRQQSLFEEACIAGVGMLPPTLKTKDWKVMINGLLAGREVIEAPEGMKTEDQLLEHLEDYCSDRRQTKRKEDIERGNVWSDEQNHYFKFRHFFHEHLQRRRWAHDYQKTSAWMKEWFDAQIKVLDASGKSMKVMYVKKFDIKKTEFKSPGYKPKDPY